VKGKLNGWALKYMPWMVSTFFTIMAVIVTSIISFTLLRADVDNVKVDIVEVKVHIQNNTDNYNDINGRLSKIEGALGVKN